MGQRTKPFQAPITRGRSCGGPPRSARGSPLPPFPPAVPPAPSARSDAAPQLDGKGRIHPSLRRAREGVLRGARPGRGDPRRESGTQAVQVVGTGNDTFGFVPSIQVVQGINQGSRSR